LQEAFTHIAEELRRQYSIGYYPKRATDAGVRRRIRVRVDRENVAVRARAGYVYTGATAGAATPASNAKDRERTSPAPVLQKKPLVSKL
jgi:hypothetical protein